MTHSLQTFSRLCWYFQFAGTTSVVLWLAAVAALAVFAFSLRRAVFYCIAAVLCGVGLLLTYVLGGPLLLGLWALLTAALAAVWRRLPRTALCAAVLAAAALGAVLAEVNSRAVSEIRVDRSKELQEARRRQEALRAAKVASILAQSAEIQFPEDSPQDRLDLAGKTATQAALLTASQSATRPGSTIPEYKRRGKRRRHTATTAPGEFADLAEQLAPRLQPGRMMKYWDVVRANRLDRVNLLAVRLGLLAALLALATDYLSRFNLTFGALAPLPVASPCVDALFAKAHSTFVQSRGAEALRAFLEELIRKGETFIYFGPADPWRDAPPPRPRLDLPAVLRRRPARAADQPVLHRLPLGLWPIRNLIVRPGDAFPDGEFVFESAWFGRYCFTVESAELAGELLAGLMAHMRMRHLARASARRTVNLIWHLPPPPPAVLAELTYLCRQVNFRLVVWSADPLPPEVARHFEERLQAPPAN